MSVEELEQYSKDQLIEELINRQTFVGVVIFHRSDAKSGQLKPGEIVITKSPPLSREGVEQLLEVGESQVAVMFAPKVAGGEESSDALQVHRERPPLRMDESGAVRVGKSRVSLDVIVDHYENGMTPEDMVRAYDTLDLADVYGTIEYYLRHRDAVRAHLKRRAEEAANLRATIEASRASLTREELLARYSAGEKSNAPAGK